MTRNYQEIVEKILYTKEDTSVNLSVYSYVELKTMVELAYEIALDEHHILHGERAKEFMEEVMNPRPVSEKQQKFLDDCMESYKRSGLVKKDES